jgi:hypothetical protein
VLSLLQPKNNGIIEDIPIRVEVLGREEVNEEIVTGPENISKMLNETCRIVIQQIPAISGRLSFRPLEFLGKAKIIEKHKMYRILPIYILLEAMLDRLLFSD